MSVSVGQQIKPLNLTKIKYQTYQLDTSFKCCLCCLDHSQLVKAQSHAQSWVWRAIRRDLEHIPVERQRLCIGFPNKMDTCHSKQCGDAPWVLSKNLLKVSMSVIIRVACKQEQAYSRAKYISLLILKTVLKVNNDPGTYPC